MLNTIRTILCLVLLMAGCQCSQPAKTASNRVLGDYDLSAYDKSGRLVFTGTIHLETIERNHLKGRCTIVKEKDAPETTPEKNGACEATLDGKAIDFDLAPLLADGGVRYEGELNDGKITGVWKLQGFAGSNAMGRILAVKRRD